MLIIENDDIRSKFFKDHAIIVANSVVNVHICNHPSRRHVSDVTDSAGRTIGLFFAYITRTLMIKVDRGYMSNISHQ